MSTIAVWCRHKDDCIIGIGPKIPWFIKSDLKRFRKITEHTSIVVGQTTYESFPNRTLPNRIIYILTFDPDYQVSDPEHHFVVTDFHNLPKTDDNLYICGGSSVYKLFMKNDLVDIVVDSCFDGELESGLVGPKIDIAECIEKMTSDFDQVSPEVEVDQVKTSVWVRKTSTLAKELIEKLVEIVDNSKNY